MARRKRRRHVAINSPRRRRRHVAHNPRRRRHVFMNSHHRRRRHHAFSNPRRRHRVRHNPPGGIVGGIMQGAKDGTAVVVGQVGTRKLASAVTGMFASVPAIATPSATVKIALQVGAAVGVSLIARKAIPGQYARMVVAGAFSEAINCALAQTPLATYLGGVRRPVRLGAIGPAPTRSLNGYPGNARVAQLGAYVRPTMPSVVQVS